MSFRNSSYYAVLLLLFLDCAVSSRDYKAEMPKDYQEEQDEELGSLFGKNGFTLLFNNKQDKSTNSAASLQGGAKKNAKHNDSASLKVAKGANKKLSKKDKAWNAALQVLNSITLVYVNKESGIIKTEETGIEDFDNTGACKYRITINVSENGDVSVFIKAEGDSEPRVKKHQESLLNKIIKLTKTQ